MTDDEKNTLDGQYCFTCRKKYGYYANSDSFRVPKNLVIDAVPNLVDIPVSGGIATLGREHGEAGHGISFWASNCCH